MTLRISCLETVLIEGTSSSLENHRGLNFDNVMPSLGNFVLKMRIFIMFSPYRSVRLDLLEMEFIVAETKI